MTSRPRSAGGRICKTFEYHWYNDGRSSKFAATPTAAPWPGGKGLCVGALAADAKEPSVPNVGFDPSGVTLPSPEASPAKKAKPQQGHHLDQLHFQKKVEGLKAQLREAKAQKTELEVKHEEALEEIRSLHRQGDRTRVMLESERRAMDYGARQALLGTWIEEEAAIMALNDCREELTKWRAKAEKLEDKDELLRQQYAELQNTYKVACSEASAAKRKLAYLESNSTNAVALSQQVMLLNSKLERAESELKDCKEVLRVTRSVFNEKFSAMQTQLEEAQEENAALEEQLTKLAASAGSSRISQRRSTSKQLVEAVQALITESATQTEPLAEQKWSHVLGRLGQGLKEQFPTSKVSVYEFVRQWAESQDSKMDAAKFLMSEEEAASLIQRAWRLCKSKKIHKESLRHTLFSVVGLGNEAAAASRMPTLTQRKEDAKKAAQAVFHAPNAPKIEIVQKRSIQATELVEQLKEKRSRQVKTRQDHGFQSMALDDVSLIAREKSLKLQREVQKFADLTQGTLQNFEIKSRNTQRCMARRKYGNDFSCLTDTLQTSIVYPDILMAYDGLIKILNTELESGRVRHDFHVVSVSDHALNEGNHRDISLKVAVDGFLAELLLVLSPLMESKQWCESKKIFEYQQQASELLLEASMWRFSGQIERLVRKHQLCGDETLDKHGRSALHYCCHHGLLDCASILMRQDADVWRGDRTEEGKCGVLPAELALHRGHLDVLQVVLRKMMVHKPKSPLTALHRFLHSIVLWWVDFAAGGRTDGEVFEHQSYELREEWLSVGILMLKTLSCWDEDLSFQREFEECFRKAAGSNDLSRMMAFLMMGVDAFSVGMNVNGVKSTALDRAIESGNAIGSRQIAMYIGMDNAASACVKPPEEPGLNQHLVEAALYHDIARAEAALAAGADPNFPARDPALVRTSLMIFAAAGLIGACLKLLDYGADICLEDKYGCRASHYALACGHDAVEEYLIKEEKQPQRERFMPVGDLYEKVASSCCPSAVWRWVEQKKDQLKVDIAQEMLDEMRQQNVHNPQKAKQQEDSQAQQEEQEPKEEDTLTVRVTKRLSEIINKPMQGGFKPTALFLATSLACRDSDRPNDPRGHVMKALLVAKADPSVPDVLGETPLHVAALRQKTDIYDELFKSLVDLYGERTAKGFVHSKQNKQNRTPVMLLEESSVKTQAAQEKQKQEDHRVLRFVFAFWGHFLPSMRALEWNSLFEGIGDGGLDAVRDKMPTPGKSNRKTLNKGDRAKTFNKTKTFNEDSEVTPARRRVSAGFASESAHGADSHVRHAETAPELQAEDQDQVPSPAEAPKSRPSTSARQSPKKIRSAKSILGGDNTALNETI